MSLHAIFAAATLGLRLPVLHTTRTFLPLDTPHLTLDEDEWRELGVRSTGRTLVGLIHTPRHERSAPMGACGVVCEVSDAGSNEGEELFVLQAVAFSRFRVRQCVDAYSPVPIFDVDPWTDAQPEDDESLRATFSLTERRPALQALEMRCHLVFSNVVQLLRWSGPGVASISASLAKLGPDAREELFRAVDRFAPSAAQHVAFASVVPADESHAADTEVETESIVVAKAEAMDATEADAEEADAEDDVCVVDADAEDVCDLERLYLHACVEPESSYTTGGEGPTGRLQARELSDFQPSRHELYSFAMSRLHDQSPDEAQSLLEGRSTAVRLATSEAHLKATKTWLSGQLGLNQDTSMMTGNQPTSSPLPGPRALLAKIVPSNGPALQVRVRRIWRTICEPPQPLAGQPRKDGWDALEQNIF